MSLTKKLHKTKGTREYRGEQLLKKSVIFVMSRKVSIPVLPAAIKWLLVKSDSVGSQVNPPPSKLLENLFFTVKDSAAH